MVWFVREFDGTIFKNGFSNECRQWPGDGSDKETEFHLRMLIILMTQYILCSSQFAKKDATISERCQHCVFAMSANFDGENTYYGEREREK